MWRQHRIKVSLIAIGFFSLGLTAGVLSPPLRGSYAFTSRHGLRVLDLTRRIQPYQVDNIIQDFLDAQGGEIPNWQKPLNSVALFVTDSPVDSTKSLHMEYLGMYADIRMWIAFPEDKCIAETSLTHELAHLFQEQVYGGPRDYQHVDPFWWGSKGVVAKAKAKSIKKLCPKKRIPEGVEEMRLEREWRLD